MHADQFDLKFKLSYFEQLHFYSTFSVDATVRNYEAHANRPKTVNYFLLVMSHEYSFTSNFLLTFMHLCNWATTCFDIFEWWWPKYKVYTCSKIMIGLTEEKGCFHVKLLLPLLLMTGCRHKEIKYLKIWNMQFNKITEDLHCGTTTNGCTGGLIWKFRLEYGIYLNSEYLQIFP